MLGEVRDEGRSAEEAGVGTSGPHVLSEIGAQATQVINRDPYKVFVSTTTEFRVFKIS